MDVAALATPLYVGSMAWEHRVLRKRAESTGATAADYVRPDTTASLAMGISSLIVPITQYLGRHIVPGRGRFAKAMLATVAVAGVATTIADRVARSAASTSSTSATSATSPGGRLARRARRISAVGGVASMAGVGLVLTASTGHLSSVSRQWTKGKHRDLGTGVIAWSIALIGWDFAYYWNHRLQHEVRAMWAIHVVHHSSERYNLSTALRQPVASAFGVWVPYGAMARAGVRPALIEYSRGINLIYQFWIHTDTIRSLGRPVEAVLNTPSHHRVHHGSNRRYLDRNHAGIFIVWDRLFGTFQRELPEEPVVYGLTRNIGTHRLWSVMTHEYRSMFRDVAGSTSWRDRLSYALRAPGWSPTPPLPPPHAGFLKASAPSTVV